MRIAKRADSGSQRWAKSLADPRSRKKRSLFAGLLVALLGGMTLTACSSEDAASQKHYVEPAWMAEVREEKELALLALESCFAQLGLESNYSLEGNAIVPVLTDTTPDLDAEVD